MNLPTPEALETLTNKAIRAGIDAAEREEWLAAEAAEAERIKQTAKAEQILLAVPGLCEKAAKSKQFRAEVMKLDYFDYKSSGGGMKNELDPTDLVTLAPLIVYNTLKDAHLRPKIESWHDGAGMDGGYKIIVQWDKPKPTKR